MRRTMFRVLLVSVLAWTPAALAEDGADGSKLAKADKAAAQRLDRAVKSAFELPRNVKPTPEQSEAIAKVKEYFELPLLAALDYVQQTEDKNERAMALKMVRLLRKEIHAEIATIFDKRSADAQPGTHDSKRANVAGMVPEGQERMVQGAFALPRGLRPTPSESQALAQMKERFEEPLRSAVARAQQTEDKMEQMRAIAEVKQIHNEIRAGLVTIFAKRIEAAWNAAKKNARDQRDWRHGGRREPDRHRGRPLEKAGPRKKR